MAARAGGTFEGAAHESDRPARRAFDRGGGIGGIGADRALDAHAANGDALWERLIEVPFENKIPADRRDPFLELGSGGIETLLPARYDDSNQDAAGYDRR